MCDRLPTRKERRGGGGDNGIGYAWSRLAAIFDDRL